MQRTNIELERQRHLANWLVKSSPHMAAAAAAGAAPPTAGVGTGAAVVGAAVVGGVAAAVHGAPGNSAAAACNGAPPGAHHGHMAVATAAAAAAAAAEARKPKLRRFNSHDTSSNMFSVADFENARLARRNEIELKQRLARRQRNSANCSYGLAGGCASSNGNNNNNNTNNAGYSGSNNASYSGFCGGLNGSGDYSTGDSKNSKCSSSSEQEPLPADVFLERHSLPRVVRILYSSKSSNETLQSSSSHGSSTAASSSSSTGPKQQQQLANESGNGTGTGTGTNSSSSAGSGNHNSSSCVQPGHDELFLLYRLVRQRHIYHGHNAKSQASQRKKTVLIPQEFPGYFSLLNEKGLPTATQYGTLMQLVRERVYKFASVDNMPAFTESSPSGANNSPSHEGCLPSSKQRPQYIKTTARGGQVFRLLAVFEDGKQEHGQASHTNSVCKSHVVASGGYMGRDKEKGRYAQLLNEQRQVMYVPLATKGKFYEIEPGIPQLLQKQGDMQRKLNPECVHRLGALVAAAKQLPLMLRYISGPAGAEIPEQLCISRMSKEDVIIGCPIEELDGNGPLPPVQQQHQPLQLRKLYISREMQLLKCLLGFDSEQRMLANAQVQTMLKFCQFNCDQFLKLVEIELLQRSERSGSKTREGLKILKPLHLPKLLRREKSSMTATSTAAHEKEDSIIFLSKTDLEQLEAKEAAAAAAASLATGEASNQVAPNRITERMKVFQSTKKKWFRKQQQQQEQQLDKSQTELQLDVQAKRMSMERYTDMSKLLQERFGNDNNEPAAATTDTQSLHSETETTTLSHSMERSSMPKSLDTLLQKSMSLQDIELLNGQRPQQRPDLLTAHTDAISEAGTELEDVENQTPPPQSFITEKLYNEFHVKTRQYSKSSSSLHQLRHFSLPQKLQLHETEPEKRIQTQFRAQQQLQLGKEFGEPITGRRAAGGVSLLGGLVALSPAALLSPTSLVEDDLPYSSVRDSLVMASLDSGEHREPAPITPAALDYAKENIYAEICASHTCDSFSGATQLTQLPPHDNGDVLVDDEDEDDGDYASLKYQPNGPQSVSRVEINCTPATSAISYHTVYLGEEPLGERHAAAAQHITTVELAGENNIYNTLK
ncbi:uncharacterized protein LOC115758342 isoform X1 [Drosophila novamexicana]|uniref:uncharacterized protein LOC115758342 isoform X1 n=2 Tax=Drosophila novamexicana TaxID=47314 RepID=UPI0011E5E9F7|nr:uncharacterized protein LOC115758342 isoform X1 [Drosophila novamexicana]